MRPLGKLDRKAPRFRKEKMPLLNRFFFAEFKKANPQYKNVPDSDLKKILSTFHKLFKDKVADTRDGVELLEQLGYMFVGSSCKKKGIDYIKSEEYGVEVKNPNWESNQWLCKLYYTNFATRYRFKNASLWGFEACRTFKQQISKAYIKNYKMYLITDNLVRISKIFRRDNSRFWNNRRPKTQEE